LGPVNSLTGISELVTLTVATSGLPEAPYGWDGATFVGRYIHELGKNINTNSSTTLVSTLDHSVEHPSPDRMAIVYDPSNNLIWTGGLSLGCYNFNNNMYDYLNTSFRTLGCNVHGDIHECVINNDGQYNLFVACDGGLAKASLVLDTIIPEPDEPWDTVVVHHGGELGRPGGIPNPSTICFNRINYGLNVCLINGFSGSEEHPNLYAIGAQDIINTDIYDEATQQNRYTHYTWENDGALIYKFDDDLMILDNSSYNSYYQISLDNGATISPQNSFLKPKSTLPFEPSSTSYNAQAGFGSQRFKQDPYRPGRVYSFGHLEWPQFMQFDFNIKKFVYKLRFDNYFPEIIWAQQSQDISFSPQTPNSIHIITTNRYYPMYDQNAPSRVFKYIGENFEECFDGHNAYEYFDIVSSTWKPQWLDITPDYISFSSVGGGAIDILREDRGRASFWAIETSPWNKDLIYVACDINNTGPNQAIKVLKYDGTTWTDYSNGIPVEEFVSTMVMDHESNDGIYLSTDKGVYFRNAGMSNWIPYSNDLPIIGSKQMEINYSENTVRAGTYGMGIWKSSLYCPHLQNLSKTGSITPYVYEAANITASGVTTMTGGPTAFRGTNSVTLNPGFVATGSITPNTYCLAYIHGCMGTGNSPALNRNHSFSSSFLQEREKDENEAKEAKEESIDIYPNPGNGVFILTVSSDEKAFIEVYNMNGKKVKSITTQRDKFNYEIDLTGFTKGVYLVNMASEGKQISKKIILE
jgi:hypothetical protein